VTPEGVTASTPETLVRVLGPVSATVDGRPCGISSPLQRGLLGLLAADAGRVVSVDRLLTELWGDSMTESALSSLQVCVSRLRRALGDTSSGDSTEPPSVRVTRRAPGYVLELPEGALDAWRLTRLAEAARARVTSDPGAALELLDEGLALVMGEPLSDVVDALGPVAAAEAQRLADLVLRARETRVEALLGVGRASDAATAAEHLLVGQPLRESLHALRLLALYRSGRQTDALAAYQTLRDQLSEDVGVDPGPALRRLHAQLLQQDPALDWIPPRTPAVVEGVQGTLADAVGPIRPAGEPPLLGRDAEVDVLERAVRRSAHGHGAVWVVSGEAGIGKTRLAQEVAARTRAAGTAVAVGQTNETSDSTPYWPWSQVLRNLPGVPGDGPAGVVMGTAGLAEGTSLTQAALHDAVADLLVAEARRSGPLLVIIEDLHWADEASLALLSTVAGRVHDVPFVLLCTYRLEDAAPAGAFGSMLAQLARTPATERLRLSGLTEETSRDLLAARLGWQPDEALAARAVERTGGNPFFLQELARLVRDSHDPRLAWDDIPETVHDVLTHRLSRLPVPARRLLDVAAVVGRDCELGLLEAVSGLPPDDVDTGLAAAVASGLTVEIGSPVPILHFQHALIREALYAQLGARARMRLHATVGDAMSARPGVDVDDLVHQLMAGGDLVDPGLVITTATEAVDRAMTQLAFDHADELIGQALGLLERVPAGAGRDGLELALQARRGTLAMTRLGLGAPEAGAALERALDLALRLEPGPDVFAAVYRRYLWLLMAGDFAAVQRLADVVLAHAAAAPGPQAADRFALLGRLARGSVLWCLGDAEPAADELEQALQLAEAAGAGVLVMAFGDPAVRIRMFLCHALAEAGRHDEAIAVADEMVRQAHLSGPADESDALATRGMMYAAFDEPRKAHDDGIEGRRLGRLAGADLLGHFAALNESWGDAIAGGTGAVVAVEMARAAAAGYRATGTRMHDPIVYAMLAEAEAATGHPDRAAEAASIGLDALARTGSRLWRGRLERAADAARSPAS
jgi:DNA-binding SARP family transcriptional activator/tetratricopeptide (TPR) repeat protein